jgi:hypothetical protein
MSEHGLRTILCAGNGVSREPRALAAAGFDVTSLDISPVAVSYAKAHDADSHRLGYFCSPKLHRPGGRVEFVAGDLLDITVCPGPFDVVIERRTVQWFAEHGIEKGDIQDFWPNNPLQQTDHAIGSFASFNGSPA